jgi:hypothetical protein
VINAARAALAAARSERKEGKLTEGGSDEGRGAIGFLLRRM